MATAPTTSTTSTAPPATPRKNPYAAFNFKVALDGETAPDFAGFMEISGLDSENAVIEYREGADQIAGSGAYLRKQPGLERYPNNVTMRRGITDNLTLWTDLRQKVRDATYKPQTLKVTLQDENHTPVRSWTLTNAWVFKLSGPSLNAKGNEIAIESIEVAYDRLEDISLT